MPPVTPHTEIKRCTSLHWHMAALSCAELRRATQLGDNAVCACLQNLCINIKEKMCGIDPLSFTKYYISAYIVSVIMNIVPTATGMNLT